jgi:hypothetical protein
VTDWLLLLQLSLTAGLLAVIAERAFYLLYVAPASAAAISWLSKLLGDRRDGAVEQAIYWARGRRETHIAGVLLAVLAPPAHADEDDDLSEVISTLSERAVARLRLLRVGATVASTSGLLVGIVRISGGYAPASGLLALEAGLNERLALSSALFSMAIGVGTSAVCFYATALFRRSAQQLLTQSTRVMQLAKSVA